MQYQFRGQTVDGTPAVIAAVPRLPFFNLDGETRKALIDHFCRAGKAPFEAPGKASRPDRQVTDAAVHVQGIAHENEIRLPFVEDRTHAVPVRLSIPGTQDAQGLARIQERIAHGDADLTQAEIEGDEAGGKTPLGRGGVQA